MRYFFEISYKGTNYHGWQRQPNAHTVQAEVEDKLSTLYSEEITITANGRTDTGVHCDQQYFHLDLEHELSEDDRRRINSFLPEDILIRQIHKVRQDAHARFDAIYRKYEYKILREKGTEKPFTGNANCEERRLSRT